jgi:fructokinase
MVRQALVENLRLANIIKASLEDLRNIFGSLTTEGYFQKIREINKEAMIIITRGEEGATGTYREATVASPAKQINVVSTIGAGDGFNAGIVYALENLTRSSLPAEEYLKSIMESGTAFASEVCGTMDNYVRKNFRKGKPI